MSCQVQLSVWRLVDLQMIAMLQAASKHALTLQPRLTC